MFLGELGISLLKGRILLRVVLLINVAFVFGVVAGADCLVGFAPHCLPFPPVLELLFPLTPLLAPRVAPLVTSLFTLI